MGERSGSMPPAAENGYVRGEGCGIVVLKRLGEAQADGDRIWGVIRATALNQDGASPGVTVPSRAAQEKCIEAALARAGIEPARVDYLEAHGTGTPVGDSIELEATAAVYRRGRDPERPLSIGSVKTNIGHLGSAAGVAGVIKTILAMKHRVTPRHLHFRTPKRGCPSRGPLRDPPRRSLCAAVFVLAFREPPSAVVEHPRALRKQAAEPLELPRRLFERRPFELPSVSRIDEVDDLG